MTPREVLAFSLAIAASCAASPCVRGFQSPKPNQTTPSEREGVLVEFTTRDLEDDWTVTSVPDAPKDVVDDAHKLHEKIVELVLPEDGFARLDAATSRNGRSILVVVSYHGYKGADGKYVSHDPSTLVWRDWRSPDDFFRLEGRWSFVSNHHVGMVKRTRVVRRGELAGESKRQIRSLADPETSWLLDRTAAVADDGSVAFREGEHSREYVIVVGKLEPDGSFKEEVRYTRDEIDRAQPPNLLAWLDGGEYLLITVGQVNKGYVGTAFIRVFDRDRKRLSIRLRGVAYPEFVLSGRSFLVIRKDEAVVYAITPEERVQHRGLQKGYDRRRHEYTPSPSGELAHLGMWWGKSTKLAGGVYDLKRFGKRPIERYGDGRNFLGWLTWDAP